jgi:hypothetical protein
MKGKHISQTFICPFPHSRFTEVSAVLLRRLKSTNIYRRQSKNLSWRLENKTPKVSSALYYSIASLNLSTTIFKVWCHSRHSFNTRHTLIQYSSSAWTSPARYLPEFGINSCVWVNNSSCWAEGGMPGGNRTLTNHWPTLHPNICPCNKIPHTYNSEGRAGVGGAWVLNLSQP